MCFVITLVATLGKPLANRPIKGLTSGSGGAAPEYKKADINRAGLTNCEIMRWTKVLGVFLISIFLASCGVVQAKKIEEMYDNDRLGLLSSKSDAELCSAYNHSLSKPNTEQQIEEILRERQIGRCDARSQVRAIPLSVASAELASNEKKDVLEVNQPPSEKSKPPYVAPSSPVSAQPEKQQEKKDPVIVRDKDKREPARCITNEKCTGDDFAMNFIWTFQELIDEKSPTLSASDRLMLRSCITLSASDVTLYFFSDKYLTKKSYIKKLSSFSEALQDQNSKVSREIKSDWVGCLNVTVSPDEFARSLISALMYHRPLTDIDEFRAAPKSFEGKTLLVNGNGKFVLGTLFLQKGPGDLNPIRVITKQLEKDEITQLMKRCSNVKQYCRITVKATRNYDISPTDIEATVIQIH